MKLIKEKSSLSLGKKSLGIKPTILFVKPLKEFT
jgi:hypothetical protein